MKILLTGVSGQVGHELVRYLGELGDLVAVDRNGMDLEDLDHVRHVIRAVRPQLIVNPAAYTAVDLAESEPDRAMAINCHAPAIMAEEASRLGAAMIHYSTDYVFDGTKASPYREDDCPNPVSVYGATKLAGEQAIVASGVPHIILRTSWVYGTRGKNFLLTIRRLAQERSELRIVSDQAGAPTWSGTIAAATAGIVSQGLQADDAHTWWQERSGIYHLTSQGQTTWHGFASAIVDRLPFENKPLVLPITSQEYPTPAKRPKYSVLSSERFTKEFCSLPYWDDVLDDVMRTLL
ncbi:dTDP-4-dehydrorhamnose reductase [Noviherbaspirillum sp.]|uniref:dTDP-4-dehydrorhamnose reductase n=1 Tax=Noviherbaspirillum sp. TaxID=1926288 RepID=UPI002D6A6FAF|nr:dTDP-4-dehydrorhamnose reductase [Noviherbaspirillum sp.]HZW21732.1 dTDP-4-dehydrorhamnose reductase [Noviherbaspirillum sp.]